jgi:hypothetical protein
MQFKHPEILYVLFALLIPILIHLFQLQRFVKTPFTNVKFLKQIELQTRKSSQLKKWLVLLSRLLAFAAIIIAFAQPYHAESATDKEWNISIYLDNSISMKAKGERGALLKRAIQDLVENLPEKGTYNLLTNNNIETKLGKESLVEILKNTDYTPNNKTLTTVLLQTKQLEANTPNQYNYRLLISDFQTNKRSFYKNNDSFNFVQLHPSKKFNISIDSVYTKESTSNDFLLKIVLKNQGDDIENLSISALDKDIILAKNTVKIEANSSKIIDLRVSKKSTDILIKIATDDCYDFDNQYYISFQKPESIKVLLIGEQKKSFLDRIYTSDEFSFKKNLPKQVDYNNIDRQQVVILNTEQNIPNSLKDKLKSFVKNGGSLVILPTKKSKVADLNSLIVSFGIGQIHSKEIDSLLITKIHYSHPVLKNVFEKKISNFQYPNVSTYFDGTLLNAKPVLSFENDKTFISENRYYKGKIFWIAAPLDKKSSNFTNAPLVVPVFYNIVKQSLTQNNISYRLGTKNKIIVNTKIEKDAVLQISNNTTNIIPRQEIQSDKVILYSDAQLKTAGFYSVKDKQKILQNLAFNHQKKESSLQYIAMDSLAKTNPNINAYANVKDGLNSLAEKQATQSFFKWFVLLALLFLLIEIILLKFL